MDQPHSLRSVIFMNYLSMNTLGALEIAPKIVQFGIFLPGVDSGAGYAVSVKIIHETDQYLQAAQPALVAQAHSVDPAWVLSVRATGPLRLPLRRS